MFEKYKELFESFLKMCKEIYDNDSSYKRLEKCIGLCENLKWELIGMVHLMQAVGEITSEEYDKEINKILETFSTIKLYNAYMNDGRIMVFR